MLTVLARPTEEAILSLPSSITFLPHLLSPGARHPPTPQLPALFLDTCTTKKYRETRTKMDSGFTLHSVL